MKALYKALAGFQQDVPTIKKNASGYGYKFADLEEITKVIKPLLAKHGLGFTQPIDGTNIKTIVFHVESGEAIESLTHIPQNIQLAKMNEFQVLGSAITYVRRYSLSSILGLVTDEDADAAGEQVKTNTATEPTDDVLARAKKAINEKLVAQGYNRTDSKQTFIKAVLKKETVDSLNDADLLMDALENEQ